MPDFPLWEIRGQQSDSKPQKKSSAHRKNLWENRRGLTLLSWNPGTPRLNPEGIHKETPPPLQRWLLSILVYPQVIGVVGRLRVSFFPFARLRGAV